MVRLWDSGDSVTETGAGSASVIFLNDTVVVMLFSGFVFIGIAAEKVDMQGMFWISS
jgi:hypothetical protein